MFISVYESSTYVIYCRCNTFPSKIIRKVLRCTLFEKKKPKTTWFCIFMLVSLILWYDFERRRKSGLFWYRPCLSFLFLTYERHKYQHLTVIPIFLRQWHFSQKSQVGLLNCNSQHGFVFLCYYQLSYSTISIGLIICWQKIIW